jgi:predicted transcriptional regulator
MSADLLKRYKELAKEMDTKYQKLIREALIEYLLKKAS